jgi:beta-mannosidase
MNKKRLIYLSGKWKAWPGKKAPLPENYYTDKEITNSWYEVEVPTNWNLDNRFNNDENIVYYYKEFNISKELLSNIILLNIEEVFNYYDIYINGSKATTNQSYFIHNKVNVTDFLVEGSNFIYMKVSWPLKPETDPMIGIYKGYEYGNEENIYGGIIGNIFFEIYSKCYINSINTSYSLEVTNNVEFDIRFNTISEAAFESSIEWKLAPYNFEGRDYTGNTLKTISKGNTHIQFNFGMRQPMLWWPWEQGFPHLYKLEIKLHDLDKNVITTHTKVLGIRDIKVEDRKIYINNHRQFLRGINYLPVTYYANEITRTKLEEDIQLILDAGFNCIRLYHHIPGQQFFDICNENGLMVWQDIPFNFSCKRKEENQILRKTAQIQRRLHRNPSIIIWGVASQFELNFFNLENTSSFRSLHKKMIKTLKSIDSNRLTLSSNSYYSFLRILDWRFQISNRFKEFKIALNRIGRTDRKANLITSYGFPAYPEIATMIRMSRSLDEEAHNTWTGTQDNERRNIKIIDSQLSRKNYARASSYFMATQNFQSKLVRFYGELWRKYKYRSYNGCFLYFFNDAELVVSESLIDYYKRQKQAYNAIKNTMQPITIIMDWPSESYVDGDKVSLDIYVINDTKNEFPSTVLEWSIFSMKSENITSVKKVVDLKGDEVSKTTKLEWDIDASIEAGEYKVELSLELPTKEKVSNSYRIKIIK